MATSSRIEWTEQTWNPVTGCSKVSPGCVNCYAEVMARRLSAIGVKGYENGFKLTLHPDRLTQPLRRQRSTMYFVNSMSDLFHRDVPESFLDRVFEVVNQTPQHTYQILTKRARRLRQYFSNHSCPPNAWVGVSVEDRRHGVPRIAELSQVKAPIRFLSVEPLLEDLGSIDLTAVDWVIVGGESGHRARPMHPDWAISIKRQCDESGVAFFFKQWGKFGPDGVGRSKGANGRLLMGRTWDALPTQLEA
jgi:protein gp37